MAPNTSQVPPAVSPDWGFLRVASAAPEHRVGDISFNTEKIVEVLRETSVAGCQLAVFPELCLTSYTIGDLFHHQVWADECVQAVGRLSLICSELGVAAVVGAPLAVDGKLFNCAVAVGADGRVAGIVPKTFLPNTSEFYEARWFSSATVLTRKHVVFGGASVPFGSDLLFGIRGGSIGIEICEDLWSIVSPSARQAVAGATLLLNLSASNELLGKAEYRRDLVKQQSARCLAAYAYASAGPGESSADLVFSGHCLVAENGVMLAETERFSFESRFAIADIDLARLGFERRRNSSFSQSVPETDFRHVDLELGTWKNCGKLRRPVSRSPFVPSDRRKRAENCREIFEIQSTGLAKRLRHTGATGLVLGLSGGLDSTLAALVACRSFDKLGLPRKGIVAVTMPGFGTTERTLGNAQMLAEMLGTTLRRIPIVESVRRHFADISHAEDQHDVVFENAQARERTQILMDVANQTGSFVLGTGDLSELALGWCTFNGDHMSMYHVNAGVPKTLVKYLVEWCAEDIFTGPEAAILRDICDTPITPELLPASQQGEILQKTEETIGPYELHDFFLYNFVRCGHHPSKIAFLADAVFGDVFTSEEIAKWLGVFVRRFFQQQYKRNAMPDAPKVGSVSLSPRGDWRMPSDFAFREAAL